MIAKLRALPLQLQMLVGFLVGLGVGLVVNLTAGPDAAWVVNLTTYVTQPAGQVFLRLLFMLVLPLLFSALVIGISEMGDLGALGRTGWRTLLFTLGLSSVAVVVGLLTVNLLRPGDGVDPALAQRLLGEAASGAQAIVERSPKSLEGPAALVQIIPANVIGAAADNEILPVMFFALMFGVGVVLLQNRSPAVTTLKSAIEGLLEVSMILISLVIRLAPIAIACLMFNLAALFGWELLVRLSAYVGVVLLALGIHMFVVYSAAVWLFGGMSPIAFFRNSQEAILVAFSTASSNATLPTALRVAEDQLKLPPKISRFVLTIGATANQNGTALFEGVTVLFLAQFFGVDLTLGQQLMVMLVCILGGVGTAGVPAGSLPVVAMILGMVGVPPEGIGLILGVDRFLDMCRTALNVTGDLVAAVVVSKPERDQAAAEAAAAG
ncbi:dicarboxylate/amino acid:cation symporter [Phenylobacterium sp. LjRoot219]|uniref:dicarboxylate/amino acid:cation symporter n=1 Tax=Phenylobacterium sp. LjRoot219 TaxID=3342283 RepID=UPI003ECF758D